MHGFASVIVAGAVLFASSAAVNAQGTFDLPLFVEPRDRLLIEYTLERKRNGAGNTADVSAEIVVGEVYDDSFEATWTTHSMAVNGFVISSNSPQASELFLGVPIAYIADVDGAPLRINDKSALLTRLFDSSIWESKNEEAVESTKQFLGSLSEEALAQIFLKVPMYMSLCQGTSLPVGTRNDYAVQVPSPIGGPPADAVVSYELQTVDELNGTARVEYWVSLDPEGAKRMTMAILEQVGASDAATQQELDELMIVRNESATCDVHIGTGWVSDITYMTETKVADQHASETYTVTVDYKPSSTD